MDFFVENDYYNLKTIGSALFCIAFIYGLMPLLSVIGKIVSKIFEMGNNHIKEQMKLLEAGDRPDYLSAKKDAKQSTE